MSSNPCHIKKPVLPSAVSSTMEVSSSLLIPEPLEDPSSYKKTVRKFITLLQTSTAVVLVQLPTLNSSTFSNRQIFNCKDWTAVAKPESVHLLYPHQKCSTSIKVIWELTSLSEDMMCWVHTCAWSVPKESTFFIKFQLLLLAICHHGFRFITSHDHFRKQIQRRFDKRRSHCFGHWSHFRRYLSRFGFWISRRLLCSREGKYWNAQKRSPQLKPPSNQLLICVVFHSFLFSLNLIIFFILNFAIKHDR